MKCPLCDEKMVHVDNGRDIGRYYYCRACKKEEAECWVAYNDKLRGTPTEPVSPASNPHKKIWSNLVINTSPPTVLTFRQGVTTYPKGDCNVCGALEGGMCAVGCPNES